MSETSFQEAKILSSHGTSNKERRRPLGAIKSDGHVKPLFCEDSASRPPSRCWRGRLEAPAFFRHCLLSTRLRQSLAGPGSHSGGRFRLRPSQSEGPRPGRFGSRTDPAPQVSTFYPSKWLLALLSAGSPLSYKLYEAELLFHYFLAGLFMFRFLRSLGLLQFSALTGAFTFMFSGALVARAQHHTIVLAMAWVPLLFRRPRSSFSGLINTPWWGAANRSPPI